MPDNVKFTIKTNIEVDDYNLTAKITISGKSMTTFEKEFDLTNTEELRDFLKRLMTIINDHN